jgi:hypothetical protein
VKIVDKKTLLFVLFILAILSLVVVILWEDNQNCQEKEQAEAPSINSSQTLEEAGIVAGDILKIKECSRIRLYYVISIISDGGYPNDRLVLENPSRIYPERNKKTLWYQKRKQVVAVYHRGEPEYNEKAAEYINQPR